MKNDNPNMKLIEVRNLVVAARRQMDMARDMLSNVAFLHYAPPEETPSVNAEVAITIYRETTKLAGLAKVASVDAELLMDNCQCMRDIRQHDIELYSQKGKESDE